MPNSRLSEVVVSSYSPTGGVSEEGLGVGMCLMATLAPRAAARLLNPGCPICLSQCLLAGMVGFRQTTPPAWPPTELYLPCLAAAQTAAPRHAAGAQRWALCATEAVVQAAQWNKAL